MGLSYCDRLNPELYINEILGSYGNEYESDCQLECCAM
jgi:hypothetical protein